jgi:DNA-binding transcriptional regulator YhcF (GntR family)
VVRMTIDPAADRPAYRQLADLFRKQIVSGAYRAGSRLPSEPTVAQQYGLGRETVRRAMAVLRAEGLVITVQGEGTLVRTPAQPRRVRLGPGDWATVRVPSDGERRGLGLDEGVPVIEIHRAAGASELHPGDSTTIFTG